MIDIIRMVYEASGYDIKEAFEDINLVGFIASSREENKRDYHFVISLESNHLKDIAEIDKILDKIIKVYWYQKDLKKYNVNIDYKKNTSLVILLQFDQLQQEISFNNYIYDIEESPFYFKRYILTYTGEQKSLVEEYFSSRKENILDSIEQAICNEKNFSIYKKNIHVDALKINTKEIKSTLLYDIFSKMYIKLPFLCYPIKGEGLDNLKYNIESRIQKENKGTINNENLIDMYSQTDMNWEKLLVEIPDFSDEEIEQKLVQLMEEIKLAGEE